MMTPAELAAHYSADQLLAALCAKMDPANAVAAVRAVAPFLSEEDKATRARRLGADRSRRSYRNRQISDAEHRQTPNAQSQQAPSDSHAEPSETGEISDGCDGDKEKRFQTSKKELTAAPASAHAHESQPAEGVDYPSLETVLTFARSSAAGIPAEVAEMYWLDRTKVAPPFTFEPKVPGGQRVRVGRWQSDLCSYAVRWRGIDHLQQQLHQARLGRLTGVANGHSASRVRAGPSDPRAAVDPADFSRWLARTYPRSDQSQNPQTADFSLITEYLNSRKK